MPERTIDWGGAASPYETSVDKNDNGRVILAEDTTGGTVLLEYDESANAGSGGWIYRGPVDMNGNDVSNVGALDAQSVSAESATVTEQINIQDIPRGRGTGDLFATWETTPNQTITSSFSTQHTEVAPSTVTEIWDRPGGADKSRFGLVFVGIRTTASNHATDILAYNTATAPTVIGSDVRGAVASRTYSASGNDGIALEISDDCTVVCTVIGGGAGVPNF